jgi:hypothetical protein
MHSARLFLNCILLLFVSTFIQGGYAADREPGDPGLVGYWKLSGDCRDASGHGNHGVNHGVDLDKGRFDGRSAYIEVPASSSLRLGTGDFSFCAKAFTETNLDDVLGDIFDCYDPATRRGITLSLHSSGSGYAGQGNDRCIVFGIDNARTTSWEDCGRPCPASRYISNSMLVLLPFGRAACLSFT